MLNELENRIKDLETQIVVLEKQKQILFDFIALVPDRASAIIQSIRAGNHSEATEKLHDLESAAFTKLKDAISLKKSSY